MDKRTEQGKVKLNPGRSTAGLIIEKLKVLGFHMFAKLNSTAWHVYVIYKIKDVGPGLY